MAEASTTVGSHQFVERKVLTGWFGKLVDMIGRDNLRELHDHYGPLPDFARPKVGYRMRIVNLLRDNIKPGFTVSLVGIPLALSIAMSAGAPPNMGLAAAFWGSLIAGLLGGSQFNVAGPTASGIGIMSLYALRYGYEVLSFISILSGILMLVAVAVRFDKFLSLIPHSVMIGWTIGIACTIGGNQLPNIFGLSNLYIYESFYLNVFNVITSLGSAQIGSVIVFLIALVALLFFSWKLPRFPWLIIVALIGILFGMFSDSGFWFFSMATLNDRFPGMIFDPVKTPSLRSDFFSLEVILAAVQIAFLSLIETLISAKVADRMTNTRFAQPLEVFGVAIANIFSGIFNGIPVTATLSRTTMNVNVGATNRMSAILSGIITGILSVLLIRIIAYLPLCIIAALLWWVAIRMVNVHSVTHLWLNDPVSFKIGILTTLVTVFYDPAQGIIWGAVASIFIHGYRSSEAWAEITVGKPDEIVATLSSIQVDRQALQDTFNRQFPPTLNEDDENQNEVEMGPVGGQADNNMDIDAASDSEHGDVDQVPLDVYNNDEDAINVAGDIDPEIQEENRIFITSPKYRADHLLVRFPGELTYLNAQQHADRIAPLLGTGRWLILHLKRTYYLDLDGMDIISSMVNLVEKGGQKVIVSGFTPQILPNLEKLDWFMRARDLNRIAPDYHGAITLIKELDLQETRRREERDYHDITAYELEERERHTRYQESIEREKLAKEDRLKAVEQEARVAADNAVAHAAAQEERRAKAAAQHQVDLAAKRKADAEEFQRRLEEFEKKKQARADQKAAYLAASSESVIVDGPSLTVPHHHDHHQPPRRRESLLKLMETPVHHESVEEPISAPSGAPTVPHTAVSVEPAPSHVVIETPSDVETPLLQEPSPSPKELDDTPVVSDTPPQPEESSSVTPLELESEPVSLPPTPANTEVTSPTADTPAPATLEEHQVPPSHIAPIPIPEDISSPPPSTSAYADPFADLLGASSAPAESQAPVHEEPVHHQDPVHHEPVHAEEPTHHHEPAHHEEPVHPPEPEPHPEPVRHEEHHDEHHEPAHHHEEPQHNEPPVEKPVTPPVETTTPPPESETSSVASDGENALPTSPRIDRADLQLDDDDPFSQNPQHAAEQSQPEEPAPAVVAQLASVEFVDPFADILGGASASAVDTQPLSTTTPSEPASTHVPVPATNDYVDPFAEFGDAAPSSNEPVAAPSHPPAQAEAHPTDLSFDPFANLTTSTDDKQEDEELLL